MNIVQITPGAGAMYCGNCFRDNALVAELRKLGHNAVMVPLYLLYELSIGLSWVVFRKRQRKAESEIESEVPA